MPVCYTYFENCSQLCCNLMQQTFTMHRRQLLKQTALAVAAFTFSRDLFSREAEKIIATRALLIL